MDVKYFIPVKSEILEPLYPLLKSIAVTFSRSKSSSAPLPFSSMVSETYCLKAGSGKRFSSIIYLSPARVAA